MIISHKYKFIFIKTRKTAGTSVEVFLSGICDKNDVVTPIFPSVQGHQARNFEGFYNHISARDVKKAVGKNIWDKYFKFCIERNPWDKTLSYYYMLKSRSDSPLLFDSYMESQDFCSDYDLYSNEDQEIIVDRVLQYERLAFDLSQVFCHLGIAFDGDLGVKCKSEYRSDRQPYQNLYTEEQSRLVSKVYAREIKQFGYLYK